MRTLICGCLLAIAPSLVMAQTVPGSLSGSGETQRAPGPTPDDPMAAKLIATGPDAASFVDSYNARLDAFYNRPTTYLQVINGYCVATPMTERQFLLITRR